MVQAELLAACESRVGKSLRGKWVLDRLLGVGGMAAVYVGQHKIGRRDAIKILHPTVAQSKDLCARFEQEAHAVNQFHHPGAVEIRDIDVSDDGCPFLVMELLEGEDLGQQMQRLGALPVADLLRYCDELLDVLGAAHGQGIVHRDVKLDNLFVTGGGKLKVLDFGIARMRTGPAVTMAGARLGTTAYMAPEQVRGEEIDGRADLFAVGATMFRILTRRRIHEASGESDLMVKMGRDPAPLLSSVLPDVDPALALVVDRALEFDARHRYPSAHVMQGDVRALRAGQPPLFASTRAEEDRGEPAGHVTLVDRPLARMTPAALAPTAPVVSPTTPAAPLPAQAGAQAAAPKTVETTMPSEAIGEAVQAARTGTAVIVSAVAAAPVTLLGTMPSAGIVAAAAAVAPRQVPLIAAPPAGAPAAAPPVHVLAATTPDTQRAAGPVAPRTPHVPPPPAARAAKRGGVWLPVMIGGLLLGAAAFVVYFFVIAPALAPSEDESSAREEEAPAKGKAKKKNKDGASSAAPTVQQARPAPTTAPPGPAPAPSSTARPFPVKKPGAIPDLGRF